MEAVVKGVEVVAGEWQVKGVGTTKRGKREETVLRVESKKS